MSILDSLLGAAGQNLDVAGIASQLGIDPSVAQTAIAALGAAHGQDGDTVQTACWAAAKALAAWRVLPGACSAARTDFSA